MKRKQTDCHNEENGTHAIELKEGYEPKVHKLYSLSPKERDTMNTFIDENLAKGYIRKSKSEQASPFFFRAKKDGKLRPILDYRVLNDDTVKNAYPLPRIEDLMAKLTGAKFFTKMDLRWGFNNVRIKEGDEWKAAFITERGLFEPTVMYFGLCNSPATFQAMMNDIFKDELRHQKCYLIIYMDDLLIFAQTIEELRERTKEILQKMRENDLYLKPEKCEFEQTKLEYLGMTVEDGKVSMNPDKVKGNSRMARTDHSERSTPVPRIWKFLQEVHPQLLRHHQTT